jgi:hypothetical protein
MSPHIKHKNNIIPLLENTQIVSNYFIIYRENKGCIKQVSMIEGLMLGKFGESFFLPLKRSDITSTIIIIKINEDFF